MGFDINFFLLTLQVFVISFLTLFALRWGKGALLTFLPFLTVCMNIFVIKQTRLFGLEVTCSEGLSVGYLLGCNLLQEFYGKKAAREALWLTFFLSAAFMVLSQIHLLFEPTLHDHSHPHFAFLFQWFPRIFFSSLFCFFVVNFCDITFFSYIKKKTEGKYLAGRLLLSLFLSQCLDTVLFSFMALYGIVDKISHVIFFSLMIKLFVLFLSTPFLTFAKRITRRDQLPV